MCIANELRVGSVCACMKGMEKHRRPLCLFKTTLISIVFRSPHRFVRIMHVYSLRNDKFLSHLHCSYDVAILSTDSSRVPLSIGCCARDLLKFKFKPSAT